MKYPLGIQTFSKIINDNALYVDKTAILYELISKGSVYFLSRPRRFGKSLLISTLDALFCGEQSLFEGLAISKTDYDFAAYPVIALEFSKEEFATADNLREFISNSLDYYANKYSVTLTTSTYAQRFDELVGKIHETTGKKVVLLVDEYDKPILNNLNNPVLTEIKSVMSAFYAVAKSLDRHLRFVFITGVSKFAKVSVFSGMNNLTDISMNRRYASLCGITQQELESYFDEGIAELVDLEQSSKSELLGQIKHWYNGYLFHHQGDGVYNPYSLLSLFEHQEFKNYWYATATPTFLLNVLQDKQYDISELAQMEIGEASFEVSEPEDMDVLSLFVQTGYLSIKSYSAPLYTVDFPNYEVKRSFYDSVAARYANLNTGLGQTYTYKLITALNAGDLKAFFATLSHFFTNTPYDITLKQEKYYQSLFFAIFTLTGFDIQAEVRTNQGRIDCVLQTHDCIYIIEFKLNDTKEAALQQIHDKQYAQKYQGNDKKVVLLGVAFDQATRNIGGYLVG